MQPLARTKAAKRRNRRAINAASRAAALKLRIPQRMGLVAAAELAVDEADAERARRNEKRILSRRTGSVMDRYLKRGEVNRQQYADGERLWSDYMQSGLTATVTGSYGQSTPGTGQPTPGCGPRYAKYRDAMRAVGIILSPVLAHVVLQGLSASSWAIEHHRPISDGIVALRLALDALGAHYRGERHA